MGVDDASRGWAYLLLGLGAVAYFCLLFVWFLLPAFLAPVIADLGLTDTQAGVLAGAVPLTYIPLAMGSGLVIDRVGPLRSMGVGLVLFGGGQVLRAGAGGFPDMLLFTVCIGIGGTTVTFGLPKLVSVLFPPDRIGTASAVYLLGSTGGTATAFAFGRPTLGPLLGGWRAVFFWSGLAVLAFAAVWWLAVWRTGGDPDVDARFSLDSLGRNVRTVFSHRGMWLLVVVGTTYLMVVHGLQGWLATFLESRGLDPTLAARLTTLLVVGQAGGMLAFPAVSDAIGRRRETVVACGALVTAGIAGLLLADTVALLALGIGTVGLGAGGVSPLVRAIPVELDGIGADLTGVAVGLVFTVGEAGGFLGPVVVGTLRDVSGSFAPGLALLGLGGLCMAAAGTRLSV